jgi:hypothetical protein
MIKKRLSYHLFTMALMSAEAPLCFLSSFEEQKEVGESLKKDLQNFYLKIWMAIINI